MQPANPKTKPIVTSTAALSPEVLQFAHMIQTQKSCGGDPTQNDWAIQLLMLGSAVDRMRDRILGGVRSIAGDAALIGRYAMRIAYLMNSLNPSPAKHPDDGAVDRFADAMKEKLACARAKGQRGWNSREQCSDEYLALCLAEQIIKGNEGSFEDLANYAMMLHQRSADPRVLTEAASLLVRGKASLD